MDRERERLEQARYMERLRRKQRAREWMLGKLIQRGREDTARRKREKGVVK